MTTILIAVILGVVGVYFYADYMATNELRKRKLIDFNTLYSELSSLIGEQDVAVVKDALQKIEHIFSVPLGYIRPTDEFGKDLGCSNVLSTVDSSACEELYLYISETAKSADIYDFGSILTVSDFVMFEVRVRSRK